MKNLLLILTLVLFGIGNAQIKGEDNERYKLYPTENMHTFIKLDTSNGVMKLVQWSIEEDKRFEYVLNDLELAKSVEELTKDYNEFIENYSTGEDLTFEVYSKIHRVAKNGRFKLYSTDNIYNFILLDVIDGYTYQVQWSFEENKRFVLPIF